VSIHHHVDDDDPRPGFERSRSGFWRRTQARRRRFLDRYEQRLEERARGSVSPYSRPLRLGTGTFLILAGIAIGWLPGPGFIILAFPGALLVASEWRRGAIMLDRVENETVPWVRRTRAWLFGGPHAAWVAEDPQLWGLEQDRRRNVVPDSGARRRRDDSRRERRAWRRLSGR
jgi:hypothetical protein